MKRYDIAQSVLLPITEVLSVIAIFYASYYLRSITDGIPFIQIRIPYISEAQFFPFVVWGSIIWWIVFSVLRQYQYRPGYPLFASIGEVIRTSCIWFLLYIGFVYLTTGFLFQKEIPRLIIIYVWLLATIASIALRVLFHAVGGYIRAKGWVDKNQIAILTVNADSPLIPKKNNFSTYHLYLEGDMEKLEADIRSGHINSVYSTEDIPRDFLERIMKLCAIYGVSYSYPKVLPSLYSRPTEETFLSDIPVVMTTSVTITAWERIGKRIFDIVVSGIGLLILFPIFVVLAILIKLEDPSGPVLFKNRRIGLGGKIFSLYKFRYMYWKYSVKDAYGVDKKDDTALAYEESLKDKNNTRSGPLYKIKNDPRITRVGRIIERYSIDELPQLFNVLIGNMSLIGPRPHQPREVASYEEHQHQVLTIKPGITGMAQVYGREKNTFDEEVALDTYYIEHYSPLLDLMILGRTIIVVLLRGFQKRES